MISFENVETLGVSYENKFIGDTFLYKSEKTISIKGYVESSGSGFKGTWGEVSKLKPCSDLSDIYINGCSMGSGKVISSSFAEGNDVYDKDYTATISLLHQGNLINDINNPLFSGVDFESLDFSNVESISESMGFSRASSTVYSFSRSLDIELSSGADGVNPRDSAGLIASGLFLTAPVFDCIENDLPSFYQDYRYKVREETCDDLNFKYSFNESLDYNSDNFYIWDHSKSLNLQQNGSVEITENGSVRGNHIDRYGSALSGYNDIIANASQRASGMYQSYKTNNQFGDSCNEDFSIIGQSINSDQCAGSIDYSFSISNDEKYIEDTCIHENSTVVDKSRVGSITLRKQGSINGKGDTSSGKFQNAISCWGEIETGILPSIVDIYEDKYKQECINGYPVLSDKSVSYSEYNGSINYSFTFSDAIEASTDSRFKNLVDFNSYNLPVPLVNNFNIVNYKEISQRTNQGTVGNVRNSARFVGSSGVALEDYVGFSQNYLTILPTGSKSPFLTDLQYSFNPNTYEFNIEANINYVRYKDYLDSNADLQ